MINHSYDNSIVMFSICLDIIRTSISSIIMIMVMIIMVMIMIMFVISSVISISISIIADQGLPRVRRDE